MLWGIVRNDEQRAKKADELIDIDWSCKINKKKISPDDNKKLEKTYSKWKNI